MSTKPSKPKTGHQLPSTQRDTLISIAKKHGILKIKLFGSVARGEANPRSDLDLLVELPPKTNLLTLISIKREMEESLQRPVDLVTEAALSPYLRKQVLAEAIPL